MSGVHGSLASGVVGRMRTRGEDTKTSNQPRTNITKKIIQLERCNKDNHSQTYKTNHREKPKLKCYKFQKLHVE